MQITKTGNKIFTKLKQAQGKSINFTESKKKFNKFEILQEFQALNKPST